MLRFLAILGVLGLIGLIGVTGVALWGLHHYGRGLPDYQALADYQPPTVTRIHAGDGRLMAEYATEKRVFVPIEVMPKRLIKAFIAAEDQNFYDHPGLDPIGIARAAVQNLANLGTGRRLVGASTITQQVAKNFLLTNEVSIDRKIKEALLAIRIERALSKDRILELYLNEIFLGRRSYGVAAAAMNYFNHSLDELTLSEMAFLAGLPKAPNNYHPERHPEAAVERRNYVVGRMLAEGYVTADEAAQAMAEPIVLRTRDREAVVTAEVFAEEVRREIAERYGEAALYEGGLSVRTTVDARLQEIAERVLRDGLMAYDRRHGWRGPLAQLDPNGDWLGALREMPTPAAAGDWMLAVVIRLEDDQAQIGLADGSDGLVPFDEIKWARAWRENQRIGPVVRRPDQVLALGDVVLVEPLPLPEQAEETEAEDNPEQAGDDVAPTAPRPVLFGLRQVPAIEGGLIALDPHTGRVLAMAGGWSFEDSQFNRATQALRQPGSAFKPLVYLAALERGYTPASLVLDAPFAIDMGPGQGIWRPQNYSHDFNGPSTLRLGVEKSRNVMTVRLASTLGVEAIQEVALRFGVGDFPPALSIALGAGETRLIDLTAAYAAIVNGGRQVTPAFIERIQDRDGVTIYRRDDRTCELCLADADPEAGVPLLPDTRARLTDPATAFQMTWILKGVVDRGTGARIASLGRPLAGKTGTTNDSYDAWFVGFSPDLVVGTFGGFDNPRTLGPRETGSSVTVPIFKAFMAEALADQPIVPFRVPRGIRMVRIDAVTGTLPSPETEKAIIEAFKPGTEPTTSGPLVGASAIFGIGLEPPTTTVFDDGLY